MDILDLLIEGHMICFCELHESWRACAQSNSEFNIIFYNSELEAFVGDFLDLCRDIPEINNNLLTYSCPMCGSH